MAKVEFYHSDGLGSTIALTGDVGGVRARYQYDAWGNLESSRRNVPNRFLFTGEEQDPATGLYYLRARWYDPKVGRFLTQDPRNGIARLPQTLNPYTYALNNPVNLIDPAGLWGVPSFVKKAAHAVGSAAEAVGGAVVTAGQSVIAVAPTVLTTAAGAAITSTFGGPGAILTSTLVGAGVKVAIGLTQGQTSASAILSNALQGGLSGFTGGFTAALIKVPGLARFVWESPATKYIIAGIGVAVSAAAVVTAAAILGDGAKTPSGPCVDAGIPDVQTIGPGPPDCPDDDPLMIRGRPLTAIK